MATQNFAVSPGQPFNIEANKVRTSVSSSWTTIAADTTPDRAVAVHGIYWSSITSGSILQIRDREEDEWYYYKAYETSGLLRIPTIDYLTLPTPLFTQFEYFDSEGSNTIIIYGVYI